MTQKRDPYKTTHYNDLVYERYNQSSTIKRLYLGKYFKDMRLRELNSNESLDRPNTGVS